MAWQLPCSVKKNRLNSHVQPPKYCQQAVSTKSPIQRGYAALTGLKGLIYISSSLKARMASQGRDGIGETYQSVPAYAGLRRFYSCAICNYIMPPSMPLTRHHYTNDEFLLKSTQRIMIFAFFAFLHFCIFAFLHFCISGKWMLFHMARIFFN
ncbi:hypothetical protein [Escherichia coli]|uniref:hypothetical protein n=1 Tax=Escherichia coli TaxID=562 RepID=UPI0015942283|nr:hypothetical protein [Escherichia coli]